GEHRDLTKPGARLRVRDRLLALPRVAGRYAVGAQGRPVTSHRCAPRRAAEADQDRGARGAECAEERDGPGCRRPGDRNCGRYGEASLRIDSSGWSLNLRGTDLARAALAISPSLAIERYRPGWRSVRNTASSSASVERCPSGSARYSLMASSVDITARAAVA